MFVPLLQSTHRGLNPEQTTSLGKKNHDLDQMSDRQIRIRGKDARDKDDTQTVISVARSMLSESKVSGGLAN